MSSKIDLWEGDCLELMKQIPDGSVDLVLTDPPYKLVAGGRRGKSPKGIFSENELNTRKGKLFQHNNIEFSEWVSLLKRKVKDSAHLLIFCNGRNLKSLLTECSEHFTYKNILVWNKGNKTPSRNYMQQVEYIVMFSNGRCKGIKNMGSSNLLDYKNIIGTKKHPTEKPTNLLMHLIDNSSKKGETVLDIFMGSGSTGVAAKNLNRNFIGIELDETYFKIAQERIADA